MLPWQSCRRASSPARSCAVGDARWTRGGCWFESEGLKVHLGVEANFRPATKAHPAFIVDDVRRMGAAIAAAGFAVNDDEPLDGFDRVYVSDPFGNRIELMQPHL